MGEDFSLFRSLLSSGAASLRDVDEHARTLLHYALLFEEGNQFCRFLLDNGAQYQLEVVLSRSNWSYYDRTTPLHVAMLVLNQKIQGGEEAPTWVYEQIRWLVEAGADVHLSNPEGGESCFDLAFRIDDYELQRAIILQAHFDVTYRILVAGAGSRPLLLQWLLHCPKATPANLGLLAKVGANVNARNSYGQNCLHLCVGLTDFPAEPKALRRALVELIQHGADVHATDQMGTSVTDLAFNHPDPERKLGTYAADLWICSLAAGGYDVFGEFQDNRSRLVRFGTEYEKTHFEMLWEDIEDTSYLFNNAVKLLDENLGEMLPQVLKFLPTTVFRRILDLRPSFFRDKGGYQWVADLQEAELGTEDIEKILLAEQKTIFEELFPRLSIAPADNSHKQHNAYNLPQPKFHHKSCCHQETLETRPPEPDAWVKRVDLPGVVGCVERLTVHFFHTTLTMQPSRFSTYFANHLITTVDAKSINMDDEKVEQLMSMGGPGGLEFVKIVWRDMLHLAAEFQSTGLCCDRVTMMIQRAPNQVDVEFISLEDILAAYVELDFFGDAISPAPFMDEPVSLHEATFPRMESLYQKLVHDLPGVGFPDQSFVSWTSQWRTLKHLWLLTQMISFAMILYWQCYLGQFHSRLLQKPITSIVLGGRHEDLRLAHHTRGGGDEGNLKIIARLQDLTCAGKVLKSPVFVFTTFQSQTEPAMLYGSPENIVDTLGQSSIISTDPHDRFNTMIELRIKGGTIFPTADMSYSGRRLFHWGDLPADLEHSTFCYTDKILIGAPFTNNSCKLREEDARRAAKATGALSWVYVVKPFWFKDQIQAGIQGGQYVNLTTGVVWKRSPGCSLKEALLQGYALNKSLNFLNDLSGLQFSICTGLARRVPLRQLIVESPLFDMLDNACIDGWDGIKEHTRELFKNSISHGLLKDERRFPRDTLHEACRVLLSHLRPTGVGADGQLRILWPALEEPAHCLVVDPERHSHLQWCHMIRDNEWCATFAAMTAKCIETEGHRCPSRDANVQWRLERSVLSTAMFQPETANTLLKVGASYWIGDTGSGVWVTVREPEQGTQVLTLNRRIPPSVPRFAWRVLGWEALRECYMTETLSVDVVVYSRRRSP